MIFIHNPTPVHTLPPLLQGSMRTALHEAAMTGDSAMCSELLTAGCVVDAEDEVYLGGGVNV